MKTKDLFKPILIVLIAIAASCAPEDKAEDIPSEPRDNYIGNWLCKENSKVYSQSTYSVSLKKSNTNAKELLCSNFYQLGGDTITLMVLDGTKFTIPRQSVSGQIISGSGTAMSDNYINFSFTANDGGQTDVVTAVFSR